MKVSIRNATACEADANIIFRFVCQLAQYEREMDKVEATAADFLGQMQLDRPPFEVLIAESPSGEPVGFALYFHTYSTWKGKEGIWIEDLFVPEEWRGQGIGQKLLFSVVEIAEERQCGRVEWSVLDWNTPAIGFYERMGARRLQEWNLCRLDGENLQAGGKQE